MRKYVGLVSLGLVVVLAGCITTRMDFDGGATEEPAFDGGLRLDVPAPDVPRTDTGMLDVPMMDAGMFDAPTEDGGLDSAIADAGTDAPADAGTDAGAPTSAAFSFNGTVPAGSEQTLCIVVDAGNDVARQIRSITSTLSAGAHHVFLSRTDAPVSGPTNCPDFGNLVDTRGFFASARSSSTLELPGDAAFIIAAHQHIQIEVHRANVTAGTIAANAMITLEYYPLDGMIRLPAQMLLTGNFALNLAPGVTTATSFHAVPAGTRVFALSSHTHSLGTNVSIHRATSTTGFTTLMHQSTNWQAAPLSMFDPAATIVAGEGLRLSCSYNNTSGRLVTFGESLSDEMCLLWAYHY